MVILVLFIDFFTLLWIIPERKRSVTFYSVYFESTLIVYRYMGDYQKSQELFVV